MNRLSGAPGLLLLVWGGSLAAQVPAFPGAEGAGMFATGGRGGEVVHVTNLSVDGPGSLAAAVSQPDRIVVFDVSGIIDLAAGKKGKQPKNGGRIDVVAPNITIAGQTAPGEGICLKGGALHISAGNVIVRHLRSRRGWNWESDSGDAIEIKPSPAGERTVASGQSADRFEKRKEKKAERGKSLSNWENLSNIIIDHCSTSWATDENLTATHADRTTVSWSIAAEGCDYPNPKQTPPNHSEGSLWGSGAPNGRSTMHHMLYAHNRLRNPRTTGDADEPAVLNFYNNVVYNWSEYASHTGSEIVLLNWLNNHYQAGPDTPEAVRAHMFEFHGDPGARIFARGNFIHDAPAATADNKLAISHNQKFKRVSQADREAMKVDAPFPDAPAQPESAGQTLVSVLAGAGATLPARDSVDLRLIRSVSNGAGGVIGKETDLPDHQRWPDYRSLPPPPDSDHDGAPDFWEEQWGLDAQDPGDSARLSHGYANIEHYFNNSDPTGGGGPVVYIAATISRAIANPAQSGEWRVRRTGGTGAALNVKYAVSGDARSGEDFAPLSGTVTIPAGEKSAPISLPPLAGARDNKTVVVTLANRQTDYRVGCPSASLVVVRQSAGSSLHHD